MKKYILPCLLALTNAWVITPAFATNPSIPESYQQRYKAWAEVVSETNTKLNDLSFWSWSSSSKKKELLKEQGSNYLQLAKVHLEDIYLYLHPVLEGLHTNFGIHELNTLRNRFVQAASNISSAQHQYKQIGGDLNKKVAEMLQHTEEIADLVLETLQDIETVDGPVLSEVAAKLLEPDWAHEEAEWLAKFADGIQKGIDRAERELYENNELI